MKKVTILIIIQLSVISITISQTKKEEKQLAEYEALAIQNFKAKNYTDAFRYFKMYINLRETYSSPNDFLHYYYNAALSAYQAQMFTDANYYFRKCIDNNYEESDDAYYFMMIIEKERGNTTAQLNIIKEGLTKFPDNINLLNEITNYYLNLEQTNEAIFYCNKLLKLNPDNTSYLFALGALFDKLKDVANTKYYYRQCIEKDPEFFNAYYNLGVFYYNNAIELYDKANEIPVNESKRYDKAITIGNIELEKSLPFFEKAYQINSNEEGLESTLKAIYRRLSSRNSLFNTYYEEFQKKLNGESNHYTPYRPYNPMLADYIFNNSNEVQNNETYTYSNTNQQQQQQQINTVTKPVKQEQNTQVKPVNKNIQPEKIIDVIDKEIPYSGVSNENTFALIIGNENYQNEITVDYAINDAVIFSKYVNKTLGVPESNIRIITDATLGEIISQVKWIANIQSAYQGTASVIVYYAGHGMPDETTKDAYLLPVDGMSEMTLTAIKLDWLYNELSIFPSKQVTIFLDACFSGSARDGMLAEGRGVRIAPKANVLKSNTIVFSATNSSQTAYPFKEKNHGLFTYFLLKKLNESKGDLTMGELYDYVSTNVERKALVVKSKPQTPTIKTSYELTNIWQNRKVTE